MKYRALLTHLACLALFLIPAAVAAATNHPIQVMNTSFDPISLTIEVGDSVTWTNVGGFHNVVADSGSFRCAVGCDADTPNAGDPSSANWSFTLVFHTEEEIDYFCEVHVANGMTGTVSVQGIFGDGFESGDTTIWSVP